MAKERKDPRGRKLRTGETYIAKDGRYRYSWTDGNGKMNRAVLDRHAVSHDLYHDF